MSEEGFEVPQPHEKHLEEHAEHDDFAQRIALVTAILATIGAIFSYQAGANQNHSMNLKSRAMLLKNDGIRLQAQATDKWNYYQSTSTKAHLAKVAAELASTEEVRQKFIAEADREDKKKEEIKANAEELEKQSLEMDKQSAAVDEEAEEVLKPHERMALGMTLIQIAVALASITVLTRRKWLFWGCLASALSGIGVAVSGWI